MLGYARRELCTKWANAIDKRQAQTFTISTVLQSSIGALRHSAKEMASEFPPELKGFHRKNMLHALFVFMVPAIAGGWSFYRQEAFAADDVLKSVLTWVFIGGVGAFMLTILFKASASLPQCPQCGRKMRNVRTIKITEKQILGFKENSVWRVVECPSCRDEFRIPGLS